MNLHIRPILSALLRNRTGAVLVALQIAIALAVLVNAVYIVKQRVEKMGRPTGMDVANIFVVPSAGFTQRFDLKSSVAGGSRLPAQPARRDRRHGHQRDPAERRRQLADPRDQGRRPHRRLVRLLRDRRAGTGLPSACTWSPGATSAPTEIEPPLTTSDASRFVGSMIIVARALAERLFRKENPLGKTVYDSIGQPATIIGIVDPR